MDNFFTAVGALALSPLFVFLVIIGIFVGLGVMIVSLIVRTKR